MKTFLFLKSKNMLNAWKLYEWLFKGIMNDSVVKL